MLVKIASCEDSPSIRSSLASFFENIAKEEDIEIVVDFYSRGEQLLSKRNADYDIYVLDIHLGDNNLNGMQIANEIRRHDDKAVIIFLTCLTRYLKEGYKVKAYRYLTKPISYHEFKNEICSAVQDVRKDEKSYLNLLGHSTYNKIMFDDIYYIETYGRKTLLHTHSGDVVSTYSLSQLTKMLKEKNFFRCHNSYLINMRYIEFLDRTHVRVHGITLPISRQKVKPLKVALTEFLGDFI